MQFSFASCPGNFRLRIARDIFHALFVPPIVLSVYTKCAHIRLGYWSIPAYFLSIFIAAIARVQYSDFVQKREAERLGARPIPRVVGKWPGNIDVMLRFKKGFGKGYIFEPYLQLFEEYQCTTLNTRFLWTDNIISMDQEHSKYVLSTGFKHFWRGTAQKERLENFLGDGIFNRDEEQWKMHRAMARPFFSRDRISDFELFEKHTNHTLSILSSVASSGRPCDVQDLYARFTIDTSSEFLFGQDLNTLSGKLPVPGCEDFSAKGSGNDSWGSFVQAFQAVQQIVTLRGRVGNIWPLFELLEDKTEPHVKAINQWIEPLVQSALSHKAAMKQTGVESSLVDKTFLQHLADSTEDAGIIRDQLLNILLAARDTTACLLTYVTYFMAVYPDVARRLREEVLNNCGYNAPTYENIRKLRYMKAVIDETLRLYPPVPLNQRQSRPTSCTLPRPDPTYAVDSAQPLYMPKTTTFFYSTLLMQRNKTLWGPDADEFDPDRWIDPERLSKFTSNPMMYTPFSAGPRICIGQNYAFNEAMFFLVRLLQRFDTFTLALDAQPQSSQPPSEWKSGSGRKAIEMIRPEAGLTLFISGGLWIRLGRSEDTTMRRVSPLG